MKKFIQIASMQNIQVTPDLRSIDATNLRSPNADRLSVKPAWTRMKVLVKQGTGWYPAQMKNWHTVKTYADLGIFTIGMESDTCNDPNAEALCTKLANAEKKYQDDVKRNNEILGKSKKAAKEVMEDTYDMTNS